MDYPSIIAKGTGIVLLLMTFRSIYRHFFASKKAAAATAPGTSMASATAVAEKKPSFFEAFSNNLLLYLWLAFMLIFSTGMIVNN